MDDISLETKIATLEAKIDAIYQSTEKTRKYFQWAFILTVAAILIPLLILPLVIPFFLSSLSIPAGF